MQHDLPMSLTPVERADQRWMGQTITNARVEVTAINANPDFARFDLPLRTERIELVIINDADWPVRCSPSQAVQATQGITLNRRGDMMVCNVQEDGELAAGPWFVYSAQPLSAASIYVIEVIRDIAFDLRDPAIRQHMGVK